MLKYDKDDVAEDIDAHKIDGSRSVLFVITGMFSR